MRKDVKLGFAIGGVLLAVLIVYVLVVPGGGDKRLATSDGKSQADGGGKGVSLEPVTPAHPATQPTPGGPVAGGPPTAPPTNFTPPAGGGTDPFVEQPSNGGGGDAVASSKTKDVDWSKLLNDSQMLMVTPDKSAGSATPAATPTGKQVNTQTAVAAGTPDITKPGPTPITPPAHPKAESTAPAHPEPANHTNDLADAKGATPVTPPAAPISEPAAPTPPVAPEPATPAKTTTTTDAHGQQIHVVASGETFSTISLSAYGNPNLYAAIMRANPGVEPTKLRPGMKIVIPPAPEAKPAPAPAVSPAAPGRASVSTDNAQASSTKVEAPIDPQTQYRVQPGDSLYSIAKKLYGRGDRYVKLHEANRQLLGDDVNAVKSGQILTLPEPPTKQQQ